MRTCQDGTGGGDSDDREERKKNNHKCKFEDRIRIIDCGIANCTKPNKSISKNEELKKEIGNGIDA